jgi:DNA topoisomerase VI subunit B
MEELYWIVVAAKELMDNGADAAERNGTPPELDVRVANGVLTVRDNGAGLPPETVNGILDFGVLVSSNEAYCGITRGAQGRGLKCVLAMPFALDGTQGRSVIEACGVRHDIVLRMDRVREEMHPEHHELILDEHVVKNGTLFNVHWPESARPNSRGRGDDSYN